MKNTNNQKKQLLMKKTCYVLLKCIHITFLASKWHLFKTDICIWKRRIFCCSCLQPEKKIPSSKSTNIFALFSFVSNLNYFILKTMNLEAKFDFLKFDIVQNEYFSSILFVIVLIQFATGFSNCTFFLMAITSSFIRHWFSMDKSWIFALEVSK